MLEIVTEKPAIRFEDFLQLHRLIFPEQQISETSLRNLFYEDRTLVFLLRFNEMNAGFLFFQLAASEIEILDIGILTNCRGQGGASRLLAELINYAKKNNVQEIHLEVRSQNAAALNLYCQNGFLKTGLRKGYYSDGDDAVLMKCEI